MAMPSARYITGGSRLCPLGLRGGDGLRDGPPKTCGGGRGGGGGDGLTKTFAPAGPPGEAERSRRY